MVTKVDFSYSFAAPHRMAVCRPGNAEKTLLDVEPGKLMLSWSYEKLADFTPNIWKAPHADWKVEITPMVGGKAFGTSQWERAEEGIPCLVNTYEEDGVKCMLEVIGADSAALIRVTFENTGYEKRQLCLTCEHKSGWVISNPAWIDGKNPYTLMAMQYERPDRILVFGTGADNYPVIDEIAEKEGVLVPHCEEASSKTAINWQKTMLLLYNLDPGQKKTGWIVRPYEAYEEDLPELLRHNWENEFDNAKKEWMQLIKRVVQVQIPDKGVQKGFYACLSDMFVMREPLKDGYITATPGTEEYRSANSGEPVIADVLLDQMGLHTEAAEELRIHIESQGKDGNWADPKGWIHHIWGASGIKAWAAMEHYRLTGDRDFLNWVYPKMIASSRWQEKQRFKTRIFEKGQKTATYGLMPRGMGDCGLMNGKDFFGVFYPSNFYAVFADRLTMEAAELLDKHEDLPEIKLIYETALNDLKASLDKGAIQEGDYRWIPGTPEKECGSRWGALLSIYPCGILDGRDLLSVGTFKKIEMNTGSGGLPVGMGWMDDGCWVAMALDNISEAYLACGNGDAASRYLYPVLNHATPVYTWCEERGAEAGSTKTSGDRQHLWTPLAVCRYIRDAMVMEREDGLELVMGTPREWLASGEPLGIKDAPTHFGRISFSIWYDSQKSRIMGIVNFPYNSQLKWAVLHMRFPEDKSVRIVNTGENAVATENGEGIRWVNPKGEYVVNVEVSGQIFASGSNVHI